MALRGDGLVTQPSGGTSWPPSTLATATPGDSREPRGVKPECRTRAVHRRPAALGLAGFALATMVLSFINVGILATGRPPVVFGLALAYGGIVQLLAGMWACGSRTTRSPPSH